MITTREIAYGADGLTMIAHLARPQGDGPWPTVLIGHDGIGLDDYQRGRADDLATHGYLVLRVGSDFTVLVRDNEVCRLPPR